MNRALLFFTALALLVAGSAAASTAPAKLAPRSILTDNYDCICRTKCDYSLFSWFQKWCETPTGCGKKESPLIGNSYWWDYCDQGKTDTPRPSTPSTSSGSSSGGSSSSSGGSSSSSGASTASQAPPATQGSGSLAVYGSSGCSDPPAYRFDLQACIPVKGLMGLVPLGSVRVSCTGQGDYSVSIYGIDTGCSGNRLTDFTVPSYQSACYTLPGQLSGWSLGLAGCQAQPQPQQAPMRSGAGAAGSVGKTIGAAAVVVAAAALAV
ncbi:hypothetical protein DFJ74DRAFT_709948 [Hyaloraphidium curvatum]|nr:hypothetical protein DFJ74DRAFT_709948 [Hyaloraphidium curvatum]